MKRWMRKITVILAFAIAVWTVFITCAAVSISHVIVGTDSAYEILVARGYRLETTLAEVINGLNYLGIVPVVAIAVVILMIVFWRLISRNQPPSGNK